METRSISLVVVGDSQCGKTQLINNFTNVSFSTVRIWSFRGQFMAAIIQEILFIFC